MKSNDASRSSARLSRSVVAAAATTLLLGTVVASPLAAAAPQKKPVPTPVAIELGAAPNQDVIPLYTDRAAAVAAALGKLPAIIQNGSTNPRNMVEILVTTPVATPGRMRSVPWVKSIQGMGRI